MIGMAALMMLAMPGQLDWGGPGFSQNTRVALNRAFDPKRYFTIQPSSIEEVVLTVKASAMMETVPDYALAVAYLCEAIPGNPKACQPTYRARILRVGVGEDRYDKSFTLLKRLRSEEEDVAIRKAFDASKLDWLEADLWKCDGAIPALAKLADADWSPDIHYGMLKEPDVLLDPAMMEVMMTSGYESISTWRGWVRAPGVPVALRALLDALDKCWTPSRAPKPWLN